MTLQQLQEARHVALDIAQIERRIERLRSAMESCTRRLTDQPRGGDNSDLLADQLDQLEALERPLRAEQQRLETEWQTVESEVRELPYPLRNVITLYYFEGLYWWQVGSRIGYSESHCRRLAREFREKIERIAKDDRS